MLNALLVHGATIWLVLAAVVLLVGASINWLRVRRRSLIDSRAARVDVCCRAEASSAGQRVSLGGWLTCEEPTAAFGSNDQVAAATAFALTRPFIRPDPVTSASRRAAQLTLTTDDDQQVALIGPMVVDSGARESHPGCKVQSKSQQYLRQQAALAGEQFPPQYFTRENRLYSGDRVIARGRLRCGPSEADYRGAAVSFELVGEATEPLAVAYAGRPMVSGPCIRRSVLGFVTWVSTFVALTIVVGELAWCRADAASDDQAIAQGRLIRLGSKQVDTSHAKSYSQIWHAIAAMTQRRYEALADLRASLIKRPSKEAFQQVVMLDSIHDCSASFELLFERRQLEWIERHLKKCPPTRPRDVLLTSRARFLRGDFAGASELVALPDPFASKERIEEEVRYHLLARRYDRAQEALAALNRYNDSDMTRCLREAVRVHGRITGATWFLGTKAGEGVVSWCALLYADLDLQRNPNKRIDGNLWTHELSDGLGGLVASLLEVEAGGTARWPIPPRPTMGDFHFYKGNIAQLGLMLAVERKLQRRDDFSAVMYRAALRMRWAQLELSFGDEARARWLAAIAVEDASRLAVLVREHRWEDLCPPHNNKDACLSLRRSQATAWHQSALFRQVEIELALGESARAKKIATAISDKSEKARIALVISALQGQWRRPDVLGSSLYTTYKSWRKATEGDGEWMAEFMADGAGSVLELWIAARRLKSGRADLQRLLRWGWPRGQVATPTNAAPKVDLDALLAGPVLRLMAARALKDEALVSELKRRLKLFREVLANRRLSVLLAPL